jgi:hypothetical protein
MGARNAGNPHVACDVEGAGDVVWVGTPGPHRRASPRPYRRAGCGNGAMVEPLRHRQTKGAATDMFYLTPPRHISTLPKGEMLGASPCLPLCTWKRTQVGHRARSEKCRYCCKSPKKGSGYFPAKERSKRESPINRASGALPESPVRFALGDVVPRILIQSLHIRV